MMKRVLILLILSTVMLATAQPTWSEQKVNADSVADEAVFARIVDLELNQVRLYKALDELFKGADLTYFVDPEIRDVRVTAVLKNVSVNDAFQQILGAAGAVAERENGKLFIMRRQPYSSFAIELQRRIAEMMAELARERVGKTEDDPDVKSLEKAIEELQKRLADERTVIPQILSIPNWNYATPSTSGKGGKTQVFTINYINPAELVPLIYALGARQVTVVSGGKLVINASEEAMAQAAEIIRQVDTEEALPRPVTVKIHATYQVTDEAGKTESLESSTFGTVAEGQPIKLGTVAAPKNDDVLPGLLLDIQLLPEVGAGDQVTLVGTVAMPVPEKPEIKISDTPVAVTVKSGASAVISEGSLDISGGKLEFEIRAEVTVGKERLKTKSKGGGFSVPGVGNFGGYGGACLDLNGVMDAAATQWSEAFDAYGARMNGFAAAMDAAAAQWQRAFDGVGFMGGGFGGDTGGYGQDSDLPDCPSGGGGGGA
jgi:hypothetical protein